MNLNQTGAQELAIVIFLAFNPYSGNIMMSHQTTHTAPYSYTTLCRTRLISPISFSAHGLYEL